MHGVLYVCQFELSIISKVCHRGESWLILIGKYSRTFLVNNMIVTLDFVHMKVKKHGDIHILAWVNFGMIILLVNYDHCVN